MTISVMEQRRRELSLLVDYHAPCTWPRGDPDWKAIMFCKHFPLFVAFRSKK